MNVSICICTYGEPEWETLAKERAAVSVAAFDADVLLVHSDDGDIAGVRNAAVQATEADWLCFLDADDELCDGYLEAMQAALDARTAIVKESPIQPPPWLLVPAVQYVNEDGTCNGTPHIPDWGRPLIDINVAVIGTLIPRSLFLRVGGFRDLPVYEDWDLWLRCLRAGADLVPVREAVYCAHSTPEGRNLAALELRNATYTQIRDEHKDDAIVHGRYWERCLPV